jgi:DNA polymerase III subunit epsilon
MADRTFAALDFETASRQRTSVCAIGVVRVEDGRIRHRYQVLVRPPDTRFSFSSLHGITSGDVESAPPFPVAWREASVLLQGVDLLCAHNASFEISILHAASQRWGSPVPRARFVCTYRLAEKLCGPGFGRLDRACGRLGIALRHHDALSDAEASARIMLAAMDRGIGFCGSPPTTTPSC